MVWDRASASHWFSRVQDSTESGDSSHSAVEVMGKSLHSDKEQGSDSSRRTSGRGHGVEARQEGPGAILPGCATSSITDDWSGCGQMTVILGVLVPSSVRWRMVVPTSECYCEL